MTSHTQKYRAQKCQHADLSWGDIPTRSVITCSLSFMFGVACCGARTYRTTRFGKPPECPTGTPPQYSHLDSISFGLLSGGSAAAGGSGGGGGGGGGVCVWGGDGELAGVLVLLLTLPIITAQTNMQYTHATRNFTR